jgi:hypothetical protein|tara:strand:- start:991 stop:1533 length:543 start_codon:yes stop_codon:yes gene_type:complete
MNDSNNLRLKLRRGFFNVIGHLSDFGGSVQDTLGSLANKLYEGKHPGIKTLKKINASHYCVNTRFLFDNIHCTGNSTLDDVLHPDAEYSRLEKGGYRGFISTYRPDPEKRDIPGPDGYMDETTEAILPCIHLEGVSGGRNKTKFEVTVAYLPNAAYRFFDEGMESISETTEKIYKVLEGK